MTTRQPEKTVYRLAGLHLLNGPPGGEIIGTHGLRGKGKPSSRKCCQKTVSKGESNMRLWLLMALFVALAGALYLGFGTTHYAEKTAEIVSQLEDL